MGMKIGKRVIFGEGFAHVVDPDMIEVGDEATVKAVFQAHTFEDRVLKIGHIKLGAYSTLGTNTIPLYGAEIGEHTSVASDSVIMKGETLPVWTSWRGNPAKLEKRHDFKSLIKIEKQGSSSFFGKNADRFLKALFSVTQGHGQQK